MKFILSILAINFLISATSDQAHAACIAPRFAESAVAQRTYILEDSTDPTNPTYLKFGDRYAKSAFYGSALDGQPWGQFDFQGTCRGSITISFTPFNGTPADRIRVLSLRPLDRDYQFLQSESEPTVRFKRWSQ